jgi:hypothetical protein
MNLQGRAMFTLVIAEQKTMSYPNKSHYDVREVTLLCTYYINVDLNISSDPRLGTLRPARLRPNELIAQERVFYPDVYQSPILSITK